MPPPTPTAAVRPAPNPELIKDLPLLGTRQRIARGFQQGWNDAIENWGGARSRSVLGDTLTNNHPYSYYQDSPAVGLGHTAGRVAGDFMGNGTISTFVWNGSMPDIVSTQSRNLVGKEGLGKTIPTVASFGALLAANTLSNNINPLNVSEMGRARGYSASNPSVEDPRQTENLGMEIVDKYLGRTGRLLPWEQFHEERPEVDYETYSNYQDYMKSKGFLGIAKGTWDGVEGPELRLLGGRITPLGALGAAAVVAGAIAGRRALRPQVPQAPAPY